MKERRLLCCPWLMRRRRTAMLLLVEHDSPHHLLRVAREVPRVVGVDHPHGNHSARQSPGDVVQVPVKVHGEVPCKAALVCLRREPVLRSPAVPRGACAHWRTVGRQHLRGLVTAPTLHLRGAIRRSSQCLSHRVDSIVARIELQLMAPFT